MRRVLAFLAICAPAFGALNDAGSLNEILAKMDRSAAAFHGMTANLKQTEHTAVINDDSVQSGSIRMKRDKPGDTRMLVNFTQPDSKFVQLQGHTLDIYLPKAARVTEYDLGKNSGLIEQFLFLGFGTTRQDLMGSNTVTYGGPDTLNGQPAIRLMLVPLSKDVQQKIQKIELWLSPQTGVPLQDKLYQLGGDYQLLEFSDVKINPNLSDSELKLKLPKNVKVEKPQQ